MNYAWANPITGIREQTSHSTSERMLAEAKSRVWEELQHIIIEPIPWTIFRQEPIGEVTVNGPAIDSTRAAQFDFKYFAWTDPETGQRITSEQFPALDSVLVEQLKQLQEQRDSKDSVIIYATWPECVVNRADAKPEPAVEPAPETESEENECAAILSRKAELETVVVMDDQTKIAKVTAWALLDIAGSLRESARPNLPPRYIRQLGAWERFKRWVLGDPIEDAPEGWDDLKTSKGGTE